MAQVSIPPSPAMTRRAPLTSLPNAVNSPFQNITAAAKRQRSLSIAQRETYGQQPPQKKQIVEVPVRTPIRPSNVDSRANVSRRQSVRTRTVAGSPPTYNGVTNSNNQLLQRKAVAKATVEQQGNLESVRAWQRHYRKVFPTYVFYFESLPDDIASKFQKQIQLLGAKLEKFFSNEVTHVVTSRTIPPEVATSTSQTVHRAQISTINPLLLEREIRGQSRKVASASKTCVTHAELEIGLPLVSRPGAHMIIRRPQEVSRDVDSRKSGRGANDTLLKAREYGMKIWALEKLQRMMHAMFDNHSNQSTAYGRENNHTVPVTTHNVDLSHVLRNEKIHGPTDRDPNAVSKDLVYFKGPFLYIHDLLAVNRPIMVREYPKVKSREHGAWPQFRSVSGGRCPFIEEAVHRKREEERERQMGGVERVREKDVVNVPKMKVPRTEPSVEEQPKVRVKRSPLGEFNNLENLLNNGRPVYGTGRAFGKDGLFQVPTVVPTTRNNYHINNEMAFTATNPTNGREFNRFGAEPDASGVQPSNITSAIRSQMVSSLNDQPGQRAGTSKELYELKRKVAGNFLIGNANGKGIPNSQRMMDLVGAAAGGKDREVKVGGDRRRRLGTEGNQVLIMEDREAEERKTRLKGKDSKNGGKKKETRPGYCENCREKFDDFDDHTYSRRHRRFAADNKNWAELDDLLAQLSRPPRA